MPEAPTARHHHDPGPPPAIELTGLRFRWAPDQQDVVVLQQLSVTSGERLFVAGPSGSGKSTLLSLLAGIVTPREGSVAMLGQTVSAMGAARRDHFRADHVGYIFQQFNLVPYLTVMENVTLPLRFSRQRLEKAGGHTGQAEACRLLDHLGIPSAALHCRSVSELSVGQQQRVAAARALIGSPEILIADEPTSSLDADNRSGFLDLLFRECKAAGTTLVFVSHDRSLEEKFGQVVELGGNVERPGGNVE